MRWSVSVSVLAVAATAHPGMKAVLDEIRHLSARTATATAAPVPMIGDLATLSDAELSPTGALIKSILEHTAPPQSLEPYTAPPLDSPACRADTCCLWAHIAADLHAAFAGPSGRCTAWARRAIRLGFHDAGAWDRFAPWGGADGSIVLDPSERTRPENAGLQEIINQTAAWHAQWTARGYAVGMADLIQLAANVATVTCPRGPRVRSFVGRVDSAAEAPRGKLPSPFAGAAQLVELFANKTIDAAGLVALVGAHTTSQQRFVDAARALDPQDATPGVWDALYYKQTLAAAPPPRVFRFPSDVNLANYAATRGSFEAFAARGGQALWNNDYAREYIRLSLLGVNNINDLTECTKVLPLPSQPGWRAADQEKVDEWVASAQRNSSSERVGQALADGESL